MTDGGIGKETSDAAKQALLAAYPEHLYHRPAIEAQLAIDSIVYRRTIKFLLSSFGIDTTDVLAPEDVAICIMDLIRELDAEHAK